MSAVGCGAAFWIGISTLGDSAHGAGHVSSAAASIGCAAMVAEANQPSKSCIRPSSRAVTAVGSGTSGATLSLWRCSLGALSKESILALQPICVETAVFGSFGAKTGHHRVTGQRREGSKRMALFWPNLPFHILVGDHIDYCTALFRSLRRAARRLVRRLHGTRLSGCRCHVTGRAKSSARNSSAKLSSDAQSSEASSDTKSSGASLLRVCSCTTLTSLCLTRRLRHSTRTARTK